MNLTEYQNAAAETAIYPQEYEIIYPALGLAGEAGEVANKVKKLIRDGNTDLHSIADELGDVLWYIAALARDLGVDLDTLAKENIKKLHSRKQRGVLGGSGDKR